MDMMVEQMHDLIKEMKWSRHLNLDKTSKKKDYLTLS